MTKYYVQSGTMRTVVEAESSRKAAIWAVHQALQQVLPIDGQPPLPAATAADPDADNLSVLSERVTVSQCGFNGEQRTTMPTLDVVNQWNDLVATLNRLERLLYRAAA